MVFSSTVFLFFFFPVSLLLGIITRNKKNIRNTVLLLLSLFFYAWGEPRNIVILLASIISNYLFGLIIGKKYKRLGLVAAVIVNIGILFYFKYSSFVISTIEAFVPANNKLVVPNIVLPIGISSP